MTIVCRGQIALPETNSKLVPEKLINLEDGKFPFRAKGPISRGQTRCQFQGG